jgi:hypothetical protein
MSSNDINTINAPMFSWKPLHPNNMPCNGIDGYYSVICRKDENGNVSARKYTIIFQHKEIYHGTGFVDSNVIDRYVLFEKCYPLVNGPTEHPKPTNEFNWSNNDTITFNEHEVNDYGRFVYAYETLELAQQRAKTQYEAIYKYAISFVEQDRPQ